MRYRPEIDSPSDSAVVAVYPVLYHEGSCLFAGRSIGVDMLFQSEVTHLSDPANFYVRP